MMWTLGKFYFFYSVPERALLCQVGSMEPKTNFSSIRSPCGTSSFFFFYWIPQSSLIWPLLQHSVAKTTLPWQVSLFLYLSILISSNWSSGHLSLPPDSHCYGGLHWTQPVSPSMFPVSPAHIPVCGAALTALMFYIWPFQEKAGGGLKGQCL